MRVLNFFNFTVVLVSVFLTWKSVSADPMKIHVLENLSPHESKEVYQKLSKLGFQPSKKDLFSESKNAILITKTIQNEHEKASISIELVHLENEREIPRTLFQYKLEGNDVHAMAGALPGPEAFNPSAFTPMALGPSPQQQE